MCGIVGFTGNTENTEGYKNRAKILEQMQLRIKHRGPDGQAQYIDDQIALGHVRLSIIDLEGGTQPMGNEDSSLVVVFNGEIYNYKALQEELTSMGHRFKTASDTEVLLHGYEAWGNQLMTHLRGMFAFVIWDRKNKELFGARDFFGIKPLYYTLMDGELMFASEIKAFLPHPSFKKELNEERLPDYLTFGCVPGTETMFKNVYSLMPGYYFTFRQGMMKLVKYNLLTFAPDQKRTFSETANALEKVVNTSIKAHQISDVEVGCFLSSGVDSSYVAEELSQCQLGEHPVKTYSVGFDNARYNEAAAAGELSKKLHVENKRMMISAEDYFESLPETQYYLDEPLGNPSANNLWHLCRLAGEDLKVVLSGEGADEMFGGYCIYQEPLAVKGYQKLPAGFRRWAAATVSRLPYFKGQNFIIRGSKTIEERYIGNSNVFKPGERELYLKKHRTGRPTSYYTAPYYSRVQHMDDITKMQYLDIHAWMVQEILLKADKMSMAHSLELRVPYLDREVFDFARTIPAKYRVSKKNTKLAFREVAARTLPRENAERRKKAFPLPLGEWLREDRYYELVRQAFLSNTAERFFETDKLVELLDRHKAGKAMCLSKIWIVYTFIIWFNVYFGAEG